MQVMDILFQYFVHIEQYISLLMCQSLKGLSIFNELYHA